MVSGDQVRISNPLPPPGLELIVLQRRGLALNEHSDLFVMTVGLYGEDWRDGLCAVGSSAETLTL
jgi:hypothetical protein